MKKLLLTLGAVASVAAPVAAVVACSSDDSAADKALKTTKDNYIKQIKGSTESPAAQQALIERVNALETLQDADFAALTTAIGKLVQKAPATGTATTPIIIEDNAENFQKINQALTAVNAKYKLYEASDALFSGKTIIARPNNEGSLVLKSVKDQAFLDALTFSELQTQNILDSHSVVTHLSDAAIVGGTNNIVKGGTVSNPEYGYKVVTTGYVLDRDGTYYHFTSLKDFNDAIAGSTLPL